MLVRRAIFSLLFFSPCQGLFINECATQPILSNPRNSFIAVRKPADYVFTGQAEEKAIRKSSVVIVKRIQRADYDRVNEVCKKTGETILVLQSGTRIPVS